MKSNLPDKKVNCCALSSKYEFIIKSLNKLNIKTIPIFPIPCVSIPINCHADIQISHLNSNDFLVYHKATYLIKILKNLNKTVYIHNNKLESVYPLDIAINSFIIDNHLICNKKHTSKTLLEYCNNNNIKILNTKQGYAKCSTIIVEDKGAITSDTNIFNLLKSIKIDVLLVSNDNILLEGHNHGFIGGCCGKIDKNLLFFTGDIKKLKDYDNIKSFLNNYKIEYVCADYVRPVDIGSIIPIF